ADAPADQFGLGLRDFCSDAGKPGRQVTPDACNLARQVTPDACNLTRQVTPEACNLGRQVAAGGAQVAARDELIRLQRITPVDQAVDVVDRATGFVVRNTRRPKRFEDVQLHTAQCKTSSTLLTLWR